MSLLERLPYEWQIGWRYTRAGRAGRRNRFISFISGVSMLGIALGVAALIIVLSVMNGFQKEVRDRMLSVIAHIEVRDAAGAKMSKSKGTGVELGTVVKTSGAEILRLWASALNYHEDMRVSDEILKRISDAYRKLRNTARYCLGNLDGFDPATDRVPVSDMFEIDRWALTAMNDATKKVLAAYERYGFTEVYQTLYGFATIELSSLYFDILKDRLYTYAPKSLARRSAQTALYDIVHQFSRLIAPILVFTADEIWENIPGALAEAKGLVSGDRAPADCASGDRHA